MISYKHDIYQLLLFYMAYYNFYARVYTFGQALGRAFLHIWRFPPAKFYLIFNILLQVTAWWQAFAIKNRLTSNLLVLHYNVDFGVDLIGVPGRIFYFPLVGFLVLLLNLILAATLCRRREARPLTHIFLGSSLFFAIFLILALFAVDLINFR